jgi:hypothetical protein
MYRSLLIRKIFCRYPDTTAYKISRLNALNKTEILRKDMDDRAIRRGIEALESRRLIERSKKGSSKHCRVTLLFQRILYPHIGKDTISGLTYWNSLSPVALLLYDCCVEIVRKLGTVESNNITESRYLMRLILASLAAPPEESQTKLLLTFLKNKFKLAWLGKAKDIQKIENDDVLRIAYNSNSISVRLKDSNTKATLIVNEKRRNHKFIIEVPNYELVTNEPIMTREESFDFVLSAVISQLIPAFVFSLASNVPVSSGDFRILSKDKNFMKLLESTKIKFDERYELFGEKQNAHSTF